MRSISLGLELVSKELYPTSGILVLKNIAIFASVHIHNAQTKGTQHKSMVRPANKGRWLQHTGQFIALQAFNAFKDGNLRTWGFKPIFKPPLTSRYQYR